MSNLPQHRNLLQLIHILQILDIFPCNIGIVKEVEAMWVPWIIRVLGCKFFIQDINENVKHFFKINSLYGFKAKGPVSFCNLIFLRGTNLHV